MGKLRIRVKRPYIAYPGSTVQQNYAEDLEHGYLLWDIKSHKEFDVSFEKLPNPKPFVTIDWVGNVHETLRDAPDYPEGTRFRIRSEAKIPSKDSLLLTETLKKDFKATEVTFKDNHHVDRSQVSTGMTTIVKEDLRNPDVLLKLLQEHYAGADMEQGEWHAVYDLLKKYLSVLAAESQVRNVTWSIRNLEFSNLFGYGEDNSINFDNVTGLVGVFGPNRSGKSSIPGVIMYTLFNSTDRGVIKNKDVVNSRKDYGIGRIVFNVNGTDYLAQRKTSKSENKRGDVNAATELQLYRIHEDMELESLAGEQRTDTDKDLKKLIGDKDDFLLTSLSSQGESNIFLKNGPTKRRQILSRFLDVDVLHRIHELANADVRDLKAILRSMKDIDWEAEERAKRNKASEYEDEIRELLGQISMLNAEGQQLRTQLAVHSDVIPVTKGDVQAQEAKLAGIQKRLEAAENQIEESSTKGEDIRDKIERLETLLKQYNLDDMKSAVDAFNRMNATVTSLRSVHSSEVATLERHKRTLKILEEVPCGDEYPTCKFIKDAHETKTMVDPQVEKIKEAKQSLDEAEASLSKINVESLRQNIKKIEQLKERLSNLRLTESKLTTERVRLTSSVEQLEVELQAAETRLDELREALFNDENEEVAALRLNISKIDEELRRLEKNKMVAAANRGKVQSELEQVLRDHAARTKTLRKMKAHEVIFTGFSKKGVPNLIMSSLLPVINEEINKVLHGIVNFTVELEKEVDSDHVDIMLNYGDSRRILELGSGHEKMISSIALRVALINCSSLPKTDLFIVDEGFGAFDHQGIDECNRLLQSLKRYFKAVVIITHVDAVKEIADSMIEITKPEKDSKVVYS